MSAALPTVWTPISQGERDDAAGDCPAGLLALIGGSVGAIAGMWLFHHKTRHWYFVLGLPAILALQIGAAWLIAHYIL